MSALLRFPATVSHVNSDQPTGHTWIVAPLPFDETIGDLLAAFRLQGMASAHSDRTIDAREATITRLSHTVDVLTVDEDGLVEWLAGLDIKRSSKATYRAHVKAFFRWLAKTNRREDNPAGDLPTVRSPRGLPHPVASSDVRAILDACADPRARTTRAYVLLAAFAGLRVSEIARVRGEDFRDGQVFLTSKGEVASSVPLHPLLVELVATMPRVGWWFPSTTEAGHVDRVSVSLAIGRAMKRAGVFGVPHGLRHHFGTQVLRSTHGDLRTTQRLLRHASPATTAIYTQVADETSFRAVAGIPAA